MMARVSFGGSLRRWSSVSDAASSSRRSHCSSWLCVVELQSQRRCGQQPPLFWREFSKRHLSSNAASNTTSETRIQESSSPAGRVSPIVQLPLSAEQRTGTLAKLAESGGYVPKPEVYDERLKPGFRGGRALFLFFLCNAVPLAALLYYLREQRAQRASLTMLSLPAAADDIVSECLRVLRTAHLCFFQVPGLSALPTVHVDPHSPEASPYVPARGPLLLVPQMERNPLTDILESLVTPGLGYVHFALSRSSPHGKAVIEGSRHARLLYVSSTRGAYCSVTGAVSIVTDEDSKRHYWRDTWTPAFPRVAAEAVVPTAAAPDAAAATGAAPPERRPHWAHEDFILLRLAISEVTVQPLVDGPQRWEERRARRLDEDAGVRWEVVAAAA